METQAERLNYILNTRYAQVRKAHKAYALANQYGKERDDL